MHVTVPEYEVDSVPNVWLCPLHEWFAPRSCSFHHLTCTVTVDISCALIATSSIKHYLLWNKFVFAFVILVTAPSPRSPYPSIHYRVAPQGLV